MNGFLRSRQVRLLITAVMVATAIAIPLSGSITSTHAQGTVTISEFPTPYSQSIGITSGPDGNLWFTEYGANNIGKITPGGTVTEYSIPTSNSLPFGITSGPDGNLWFTESNTNQIGKITPSGAITEYAIPTNFSFPRSITSGPDGNLWFTESHAYNIGKITPGGTVTEYPIPTSGGTPVGITSGPDGNLWFTEYGANNIGKITPGGTVTEYPIPTSGSHVYDGISSGPDGNLWFTVLDANQIGQITPSGTITEYSVPTANSSPYGITSGPDGNLWFTEESGNNIGRVNLSSPTVTVQKIWTADGNNNTRTTFLPGDAIHYRAQMNNTNSTTVTASFNFLATGPQQIFSWSGSKLVTSGTSTITLSSAVPSNAPSGMYTLTVTVNYNGASSQGKSQFTVGNILMQSQYAGYGAYSGSSSSGPYSDIQASWQEPAAICPPSLDLQRAVAFWVGLGGLSAPLEQISTLFSCTATGQVSYHAAYQMVPQGGGGSPHILGKEACRDGDPTCSTKVDATVKANDQIHAEVKYTGSNGLFKLYIHDITQLWHFSITTSANGSGTSAARSSAECIAEDPAWLFGLQPPLADFGTVFFTNCLADTKPIGNRGPYTLEFVMQHSDGTTMAMPSQLNSKYKAFSVMWENE